MYRIALVSMPFANLKTPSIALTQLKYLTETRFPDRVTVDLAYVTHDFGQFVGMEAYNYVSNSLQALYAGFGDWFFRRVAFPDLPDNTDAYVRRFFSGQSSDINRIREMVAYKRPKLDEYLDLLIARHHLEDADIVGFTSMFMQNVASFAMARKLKQRNPRVITVMGGANCEYPMGRVIAARAPHIDFVFSGAALKSFPELVADCLDGSPGGRPITGVFSKTAAAPSASCAVLGEEMSIDEPIPLDYDQFIDSYQTHFPQARVKPVAPIETSRGCWWGEKAHCTFCGLNGATMAYRAMRPDLAIQQFNAAFRYQGRVSVIEAVDNILPTSYLEQVLPFVETPDTMELWYEVKADLSRRDMATLAKARVRKIQPGIESLATSTLKLMKKGTSACQNILFLKNCADFDIRPFWNLLIGFPGEGADVYRRYVEVLPLLVHLTPPTGVHTVRFDRFGPYHKDQRGYGLQLHPMDFYRWVYPFDDTDLIDFAYYFVDQNTKAEYVQAAAEWIRKLRALVDRWQERWSGVAGAQRPRLVFKPGSDIVCDSRDGSETEREIGALGRTLLDGAMSPTRVDVLVRDCAADPAEAHQTVALLEELGLLFREGDRVISLVMTGAEAHIAERPRAFAGAERPRSKLLPMLAS